MKSINDIMKLLQGKENDADAIKLLAREHSPLMVKIALLSLACEKRIYNPHWIGCPPSIFISYKWNGQQSRDYVGLIHDYLVSNGYKVYLDKNEINESADDFTEVPEFIANIANCQFYVLILTKITADYSVSPDHLTSWVFDEYQQAIKLVNMGRLIIVPILIEEEGLTDFFTKDLVIDLTKDIYDFSPLDNVFYPVSFNMPKNLEHVYNDFLDACDVLAMKRQWTELLDLFNEYICFKNFPDYWFRVLIYSICTKNEQIYKSSLEHLSDFTTEIKLQHLLKGYANIYSINELSSMLYQ